MTGVDVTVVTTCGTAGGPARGSAWTASTWCASSRRTSGGTTSGFQAGDARSLCRRNWCGTCATAGTRDAARKFGAVLDQFAPDLVHTHNLKGMSPSVWAEARRRGLPVVHTMHDYYLLCGRGSMLHRDGTPCRQNCLGCFAYRTWYKSESGGDRSAVQPVASPAGCACPGGRDRAARPSGGAQRPAAAAAGGCGGACRAGRGGAAAAAVPRPAATREGHSCSAGGHAQGAPAGACAYRRPRRHDRGGAAGGRTGSEAGLQRLHRRRGKAARAHRMRRRAVPLDLGRERSAGDFRSVPERQAGDCQPLRRHSRIREPWRQRAAVRHGRRRPPWRRPSIGSPPTRRCGRRCRPAPPNRPPPSPRRR